MHERKDPLALWVGSWSPQEIIEREVRRADEKQQVPSGDENAEEARRQ